MGTVVDPPQAPSVDVAVDLRGGERSVAEQLLDRAEVGAALEQVGGERMAQAMGIRHQAAQRRGVQGLAARGQEHMPRGSACQLWAGRR